MSDGRETKTFMATTDMRCSGTAEDNRGNQPGAQICHLRVPDRLRGVQKVFGGQLMETIAFQQSKKSTESGLDGLFSS